MYNLSSGKYMLLFSDSQFTMALYMETRSIINSVAVYLYFSFCLGNFACLYLSIQLLRRVQRWTTMTLVAQGIEMLSISMLM